MLVYRLQRITAVGLLFFLMLHMVMMHYPPFHISFDNILVRMQDPFWKGVEITFLFFALVHAASGSYAIFSDYEKLARFKKIFVVVLIAASIIAFYWGARTVLSWQPPV
jgi:succinate dehydrogenase / fumarate reductase cytochrome b subunit/succinate dehydrogenase / fumarate reductase membrane anchor subunit